MRRASRAAAALTLTTTLLVAASLTSQAQPDNDAKDFGTWAMAPQKTVTPQTDDQDAYNQAHGRPLPERELLQPSLDAALSSYSAKPKSSLHGDYQCGASDVLAALSKTWIKEFEKKYPRVHISVNPPYAGSLGALELVKGNLDCVFVSRELKPTDVKGFHDAFGYDPLSVPISGGSYRHFDSSTPSGSSSTRTTPSTSSRSTSSTRRSPRHATAVARPRSPGEISAPPVSGPTSRSTSSVCSRGTASRSSSASVS